MILDNLGRELDYSGYHKIIVLVYIELKKSHDSHLQTLVSFCFLTDGKPNKAHGP